MSTYSLDLDFQKPDARFPGPAVAKIYIKTSSANEAGTRFITPDCVTFRELDYQISRLKKELNTIRQKARKKFSAK